MNAPAAFPDRVANWFRRAPSAEPLDAAAQRRARFDAIGDWLFENDLEPNAVNFDFARQFLDETDPALVRAAQSLIESKGRVGERDVLRILERSATAQMPDTLNALTRELEAKVAECIAAVSDSTESTTAYSSVLDAAADDMATNPGETYRRLLETTLEVAETTRRIGGRLERTRKDTRRLRADLDKARKAAEEDHLTGLPNRRGFYTRIEEAAAARKPAGLVVALCDIDDFKSVNDRHGHDTGDRVLRFVARLLRDSLPSQVFVARYGGEEFVCLFEGEDIARAAELLDTARQRLGERVLRDQSSGAPIGAVTFTAGIATVGNDPAAALRAADEALYAGKKAGKDRIATSA